MLTYPTRIISAVQGAPLNYGERLSLYVPYMLGLNTFLPNQELSVLYGGPTLNCGGQLSLYVPYMLRVSMTGDLAHLQLSDLQGET